MLPHFMDSMAAVLTCECMHPTRQGLATQELVSPAPASDNMLTFTAAIDKASLSYIICTLSKQVLGQFLRTEHVAFWRASRTSIYIRKQF